MTTNYIDSLSDNDFVDMHLMWWKWTPEINERYWRQFIKQYNLELNK